MGWGHKVRCAICWCVCWRNWRNVVTPIINQTPIFVNTQFSLTTHILYNLKHAKQPTLLLVLHVGLNSMVSVRTINWHGMRASIHTPRVHVNQPSIKQQSYVCFTCSNQVPFYHICVDTTSAWSKQFCIKIRHENINSPLVFQSSAWAIIECLTHRRNLPCCRHSCNSGIWQTLMLRQCCYKSSGCGLVFKNGANSLARAQASQL